MEKETFNYTYSAKQQEEVQRIRKKYVEPEEDKMEQLRRLDKSVTKKGTAIAIAAGVVGTLIMGTGMSLAMVWMGVWFVPGIVIGLAGMVLIFIAYPLYSSITKKERAKIAPEIIRLTNELMK